jgi:glycosyltransferase involved in cell wall biosynthesis
MARVSICIPTYNRKAYLKETLESVFSQTYKDFEVVVVDDGSSDGTEEMIKNLGYNIRYHWQENSGDAAARNKLIELAECEYITFLDSDDLLVPDAVERMITAMESANGQAIVYGPYFRIDEHGKVFGRCKRTLYSGEVTKYLFQTIFIHSCGSMFPRAAVKEAGGFDESLVVCADYDLWLRLSLQFQFIAMEEPTFRRRRHSGNLSSPSSGNRLVELEVLERFYHERGGDKAIPKPIAMRRFSQEEYRVGKSFVKEKNFAQATRYFRLSLSHRVNVKSLLMWAFSSLKQQMP